MLILSIETVTEETSVALSLNDIVYADHRRLRGREQSDQLIAMIDGLFQQHSVKAADLDLIILDKGPGSFSGCRLGASIALALKMAARSSTLGISHLQLLAWQAKKLDLPVIACCDARMNQLYWGEYITNDTIPALLSPEQVSAAADIHTAAVRYATQEPFALVGHSLDSYRSEMAPLINKASYFDDQLVPDARQLLELGYHVFLSGDYSTGLVPNYVRNKVTY